MEGEVTIASLNETVLEIGMDNGTRGHQGCEE